MSHDIYLDLDEIISQLYIQKEKIFDIDSILNDDRLDHRIKIGSVQFLEKAIQLLEIIRDEEGWLEDEA